MRKTINDVLICLRLPAAMVRKIDSLARQEDSSRSRMIRRLLSEALQGRKDLK